MNPVITKITNFESIDENVQVEIHFMKMYLLRYDGWNGKIEIGVYKTLGNGT